MATPFVLLLSSLLVSVRAETNIPIGKFSERNFVLAINGNETFFSRVVRGRYHLDRCGYHGFLQSPGSSGELDRSVQLAERPFELSISLREC